MVRTLARRRSPCRITALLVPGLLATSCNSADSVAARFCERHRQQELALGYDLLSEQDRKEITKEAYARFEWDQQSFDIRILRQSDQCDASVTELDPTHALATVQLTSKVHERTFECVVPMVNEGGSWVVTRHWAPMDAYHAAVESAGATLDKALAEALKLEGKAHDEAAAAAMAAYWKTVGDAKVAVASAAGGKVPSYCFADLNLDRGRELIYAYLAFQEPKELVMKPKHLIEKSAQYQGIADALKASFLPLSSVAQDGVRADLVYSRLGDGTPGATSASEVRNLIAVWGPLEPPFFWTLKVFDAKQQEINEGKGAPLEVLGDLHQVIPEAPKIPLVVFEFPKMPAGTERLELRLSGGEGSTEYVLPIPVKPEFIEKS